ncbi:MAG: hypothetical protein MZV70_73005 [Desulfobacterales bacterium]|nr:hypothetical protein [Desulfobacterales bacterium]
MPRPCSAQAQSNLISRQGQTRPGHGCIARIHGDPRRRLASDIRVSSSREGRGPDLSADMSPALIGRPSYCANHTRMTKKLTLKSEISRVLACTLSERARGIIDSPYTRADPRAAPAAGRLYSHQGILGYGQPDPAPVRASRGGVPVHRPGLLGTGHLIRGYPSWNGSWRSTTPPSNP